MMIVLKPLFGSGFLGRNRDPEHKRRQVQGHMSEVEAKWKRQDDFFTPAYVEFVL